MSSEREIIIIKNTNFSLKVVLLRFSAPLQNLP